MKIFDTHYLDSLTDRSRKSPRLRQHNNIHQSYQDSCQRLFNAIEPDSYIRPHRHTSDARDELLIAIRGTMALATFDDLGNVIGILRFGSEKVGGFLAVGAEVSSTTWYTVIALESGCMLLEVKAGPFDPNRPKDLANWAPEEVSADGFRYLEQLILSASL